jgi:hypothetical protein
MGGGGFVMGDGDFWILGGTRKRGVRLLYDRKEKKRGKGGGESDLKSCSR